MNQLQVRRPVDHTYQHLLTICCLLLMPITNVTATYSIVATDAMTRQVGGAGATCLQGYDIYDWLYRSVPNRSVLHTQGLLINRNDTIVTTALDMMENSNETLDAILQEMQGLDTGSFALNDFVSLPTVTLRQFAIANFGSNAGYSGVSLGAVWAYYGFGSSELVNIGKDLLDGRYSYRAAGNVVKVGTVDSMQKGFEDQDDEFNFGLCDMPGKLMTAMYRVADGNFGDDRCLGFDGTSSTGAYLHVDNANSTEYIHINVVDSNPKEPIEELKTQFLEWRKENPCGDDWSPSSGSPSQSPSTQPSTTPNISTPTTGAVCVDSSLRFKLDWNGKRRITRDCFWIGNKATVQRCKIEGMSAACPVTCGGCETCLDSTVRFKVFWNGRQVHRDCTWVSNKATIQRCAIPGVSDLCRLTCGVCS